MSSSAQLPRAVTVRVPAKVNLELRVGPRGDDGYHELATTFLAVGLYDEVSVTRWDRWEVLASGTYAAGIPTGPDNLAIRAAQLVARRAGIDEALSVRIDKDIPIAGGMAGGSADAAAALLACDQLWGLGLGRDEFTDLAAQLGSDVPFLLTGGVCVGSGRGDVLAPVLARGSYQFVFATSDRGLATPAVYAECDRLRAAQADRALRSGRVPDPIPDPVPSPEIMSALRAGDPAALAKALHNDLQPAALSLRPDLAEVIDAGLEFGALAAVVSGSGPTVAFLTADHEAALDLSVSLSAATVASAVKIAKGPVHGAHVVAGPRG